MADRVAIDLRLSSDTVFRAVLDEFRYRYLVTYAPTGVSQPGWYTLDVGVKRSGARVRAGPGCQAR